jgi:hypothetical protein
MSEDADHGLFGGQICQPDQADAVIFSKPLIVSWVLKRECEETLLLEIGFMDARKATGDDCYATQKSGRERRMLAAAALAIVVVANNDPREPVSAIGASHA